MCAEAPVQSDESVGTRNKKKNVAAVVRAPTRVKNKEKDEKGKRTGRKEKLLFSLVVCVRVRPPNRTLLHRQQKRKKAERKEERTKKKRVATFNENKLRAKRSDAPTQSESRKALRTARKRCVCGDCKGRR